MKNMHKYYRKGFTMIEALFSLMIASLCVVLSTLCLTNVMHFMQQEWLNKDIISVKQLRTSLMEYEIVEVNRDEVLLEKDHKYYYLRYKNKRIYLTNGSYIFMKDVEDAYFKVVDDKLYLCYLKGVWYEVLLQTYFGIL